MAKIIKERVIQDAEFRDFLSFVGGNEEVLEKARAKLYNSSTENVFYDIKNWLLDKYEVFVGLFPDSTFEQSYLDNFAEKIVKRASRGRL